MAKKKPKRSSLYAKTMARLKAAEKSLQAAVNKAIACRKALSRRSAEVSNWETISKVYEAKVDGITYRIYAPHSSDTYNSNISNFWVLVNSKDNFSKRQFFKSRKLAMAAARKQSKTKRSS